MNTLSNLEENDKNAKADFFYYIPNHKIMPISFGYGNHLFHQVKKRFGHHSKTQDKITGFFLKTFPNINKNLQAIWLNKITND